MVLQFVDFPSDERKQIARLFVRVMPHGFMATRV